MAATSSSTIYTTFEVVRTVVAVCIYTLADYFLSRIRVILFPTMKKQAVGVYLMRKKQLLFLVRRKEHDTTHQQGIYLPVGGKVELGEKLEDAAIREVREESGVRVKSVTLAGIIYIIGQGTGRNDWNIFIFTATDFSGEPQTGNEGTFVWVDFRDIPQTHTYQGDQVYLPYIWKNRFFVLELYYHGFEYLTHKLLALR